MPDEDDDEAVTGRVTENRPGATDEQSKSKDRLPGAPNPDDKTPLGDTDQHSEVPSEGPRE